MGNVCADASNTRKKPFANEKIIVDRLVAGWRLGCDNDATNRTCKASARQSFRSHIPVATNNPGAAKTREKHRDFLEQTKVSFRCAFGVLKVNRTAMETAPQEASNPSSVKAALSTINDDIARVWAHTYIFLNADSTARAGRIGSSAQNFQK